MIVCPHKEWGQVGQAFQLSAINSTPITGDISHGKHLVQQFDC
jgi:hypothetical protein